VICHSNHNILAKLPLAIIITVCLNNTFAQTTNRKNVPIKDQEKYIHSGLSLSNTNQNYSYQPKLGATANDLMPKPTNGPVYKLGATPEENQKANDKFIRQQIAEQEKKYNEAAKTLREYQVVINTLNETSAAQNNISANTNYKSPEFLAKTKSYTDALNDLSDMLSDKKKLSIANAYYSIENAYGGTYLNKKEYNNVINESAAFIKKWLIQNGLNPSDNSALHLGIQKFMGETLTVTSTSPEGQILQKTTHAPFSYDFDDYKGEKDFRNYFSTKCLATGSGQCNSLPTVYLSIAEALGAKAYLSFAPHHSLIKYPADKGIIHNYEPTSNWKITDDKYMEMLFISDAAYQSGIYLDTMNNKQIVANCLVDLAWGYMQKYGPADGKFVGECLKTATIYFPKKNNIYSYFVYGDFLARKLDLVLRKYKITDLKDINKIPEASVLYEALLQNEKVIKSLGYQDQPKELYDQLMQNQEFNGQKQQSSGFNKKEKRSLFTTTLK
jgi:hypothetical protein